MADALFNEFGRQIKGLTLIPSDGGVYEVMADGNLVFSKKALGRHAETSEVVNAIRAQLGRST